MGNLIGIEAGQAHRSRSWAIPQEPIMGNPTGTDNGQSYS